MKSVLTCKIVLEESDVKRLAGLARGYFRENPRVAWKLREYREAARLAAAQIVLAKLEIDPRAYYAEPVETADPNA